MENRWLLLLLLAAVCARNGAGEDQPYPEEDRTQPLEDRLSKLQIRQQF